MYLVTKEFLDLVIETYPILKDKIEFRKFVAHLMFGKRDEDSNLPLITSKRLAIIEHGYIKAIKVGKHYRSLEFLEAFQQQIMNSDTFIWTKPDYNKHKARCAVVIWPEEIEKGLLEQYSFSSIKKEELYNFVTGNKYHPRDMTKHRTVLENEVKLINDMFATKEQKIIIDYLHSVNIKHFSKLIEPNNISNAYQKVLDIDNKTSRDHQGALLHSIYTDPRPLYQPSSAGNTVRIFPYNESMLSLKRNIRKTLCKGWYEFDLVSSQLAIISRLWNIPFIIDYINKGNSIWTDLSTHMQITYTDDSKKAIKTALYGICFGMSKKNVALHIEKYFDVEAKNLFFNNPIIQSLFKARNARVSFIMSQGYITTVYGKQVFVTGIDKKDKLTRVRSILAEEAQALEAKLLEDIIPLAKTTKDFVVTLWQSDGFSVRFTNKTKQDRWIKRILKVVEDKANQLSIPTHLEVEIL